MMRVPSRAKSSSGLMWGMAHQEFEHFADVAVVFILGIGFIAHADWNPDIEEDVPYRNGCGVNLL